MIQESASNSIVYSKKNAGKYAAPKHYFNFNSAKGWRQLLKLEHEDFHWVGVNNAINIFNIPGFLNIPSFISVIHLLKHRQRQYKQVVKVGNQKWEPIIKYY